MPSDIQENDVHFEAAEVQFTAWLRRFRPRSTRIRIRPLTVFIFLLVLFLMLRSFEALRISHFTLSNGTTSFNTVWSRYELMDQVDTFETYKFRDTCNLSSADLYAMVNPVCDDRNSMLEAMSGGGRVGWDAPYMSRGCGMRWFTTVEVCEILGRFEKVVVIGDSMSRHVVGGLNVLMRENLGYGAVTDWNFSVEERRQCFCNEQFNVKDCSVQGIYKTEDVLKHDPESLACEGVNVIVEQINRYPIPDDEIERLEKDIRGHGPMAVIFGQGLWNNLDLVATMGWLDTLLSVLNKQHPHAKKLFVTPNACGKGKPDNWIVSQGNKALMLFEEGVRIEAGIRGVEHLGTWNMSIQSRTYDGVHLDMRGNLVKVMMVLNWLNLID